MNYVRRIYYLWDSVKVLFFSDMEYMPHFLCLNSTGSHFPPGLIAYLLPPPVLTYEPLSTFLRPVLQFTPFHLLIDSVFIECLLYDRH